MVGIVIVTHDDLAKQLLETAKKIVGEATQATTLSITVNKEVEQTRNELLQAILSVDTGHGVLILTDMFGGTPSNISLSFLNEKNIEVLTGVNLPMLIKLLSLTVRDDLHALAKQIEIYGKNNIYLASDILSHKGKINKE